MFQIFNNLDLKEIMCKEEDIVFFVGAGISMNPPSNILSARGIMEGILEYIIDNQGNIYNKLKEILFNIRFEAYITIFLYLFDNNKTLLNYFLQNREPNNIHYFLARNAMRNVPILTTNFDILIEKALKNLIKSESRSTEELKKYVKLLIYDEDFKYFNEMTNNIKDEDKLNYLPLQNSPILIAKLHGSALNYFENKNTVDSIEIDIQSISRKIKEEAGSEFLGLTPYKRNFLRKILKEKTLIVMGYSGNDDLDIIPEIKKISGIKRIIWFEYEKRTDDSFEIYKLNINKTDDHIIEIFNTTSENEKSLDINYLDNFLKEFGILNPAIEIFKVKCDVFRFISNLMKYEITPDNLNLQQNLIKEFTSWLKINFDSVKKEGLIEQFIGILFYRTGKLKEALKHFTRSLKIFKDKSDKHGKLLSIILLGGIYSKLGDKNRAIQYYNEILEQFDNIDMKIEHFRKSDLELKTRTLLELGNIYYFSGNLDKATNIYGNVINYSKILENYEITAATFSQIGLIYKTKGLLDKAMDCYMRSYKAYQLLGFIEQSAMILSNMAEIYYIKGDLKSAFEKYQKSLEIGRKMNNLDITYTSLINLGNIYRQKNEYNKALESYKSAEKLSLMTGNFDDQAIAFLNIANIYVDQSKKDASKNTRYKKLKMALDLYQKARKIFEKTNNIKGLANSIGNIANIHFGLMNFQKAIDTYKKSYELEKQLGNLKGMAIKLYNIGNLYGALGKDKEALEYFSQALILSKECQFSLGIQNILSSLKYFFKNEKEMRKFLKNKKILIN